MTLDRYLSKVSLAYKKGIATEIYDDKIPKLTEKIINLIANNTGLTFILAKDPEGNVCMANNKEVRAEFRQTFSPIDILDYMYFVIHSSNFRTVGKKFLKANFPYPKNAENFWELAEIGLKIKQIHSLKTINADDLKSDFNITGNFTIRNPHFENHNLEKENSGRIYINETQCFENIPEIVWTYTIKKKQPAQKWLAERKEQKLNFEDIVLYKKIIVALSETDKVLKNSIINF